MTPSATRERAAVGRRGSRLLTALTIAALLLEGALVTAPRIEAVWRSGAFFDSDDAMRAVQLRAFLAGQGWFDLMVDRVDPPQGLVMHWSRIVDVPLAALHRLFSIFLSGDDVERATRLAFPFAFLAALYWIAGRLGAVLAGGSARLAAIWLTALSAPMFAQFAPGRIDHHAPQIVTLAATLCLLLEGFDPRRARRFAGAAALMALSASISLENLPFFVVLATAPALLFVRDGVAARAQLIFFSAGALVAFPAFYALTVRPAAYLQPVCDAFSVVHLAPVLVGAAALLGVSIVAPRLSRLSTRALAVAGAAAAAFACALAIAPQCVDPFHGLDPSLRSLWLAHVREVQPPTVAFPPDAAVGFSAPVALGLASALGFAWFDRGLARRRWLLAAAAVAVGLVLGLAQIRILTSATPLAMAPLAAAILRLVTPLRLTGALRAALVAALCVPVSTIGLTPAAGLALPAPEEEDRGDDCFAPEAFAPLAEARPARVLSTFGFGAHILAYTPHSVFAAPYHRNNRGNRFAADVFRAAPDAAETRVRAEGVDFLLWCPAIDRRSPLVSTAPSGLGAALLRGETPAWLERRSARDARLLVFAVRRVE